MNNYSIGLLLIVKNEERFINGCLESAKNFFDEIIIVDTGSNDNTISIAKKFTDKIYFFNWNDNFSEARNFGKSKVSSNWIFYLDADEQIENFDKQFFISQIQNNNVSAFFVSIKNIITHNLIQYDKQIRLFLNINEIYWKNRIHEQITDSIFEYNKKYNKIIADSNFSILHFGYRPYIIKKRNKYQRNLEILKKELSDNNFNNLYLLLKYISSLRIVDAEKNKNEIFNSIKIFFNHLKNLNNYDLLTLKPVKDFPFEISNNINLLSNDFLNEIINFYIEQKIVSIELYYLQYISALKNNHNEAAENFFKLIKYNYNKNDLTINPDLKLKLEKLL